MVRIDELHYGNKFTAVDGQHWTFLRRHGSNAGAYYAKREDGAIDVFAGCALVMQGWI